MAETKPGSKPQPLSQQAGQPQQSQQQSQQQSTQAEQQPAEGGSSKSGEFVPEGTKEAQEAGYWGTRDNPFEDEEFALTTGPNAPLTDDNGNPLDIDKDEHIVPEPEESEEAGQEAYEASQSSQREQR